MKMGDQRFGNGNTVSFGGGMSANQGLHLAAMANIAQAKSLRMQARQAKKPNEARILNARADSLEQEADRLERAYRASQKKR